MLKGKVSVGIARYGVTRELFQEELHRSNLRRNIGITQVYVRYSSVLSRKEKGYVK